MSRCGPWHYRGKKSRWRECREMHMSAEDRAWMLANSEPEHVPAGGLAWWAQHAGKAGSGKPLTIWDFKAALDFKHEAFARWVDEYEAPFFPTVPLPAFIAESTRQSPEPEQYGISDETNERARRLIESALGDES
jgi:hypothetical protein